MSRSEEVRGFYERMPYPAPLTSLDAHRELYKARDSRRAEFHLIWPAKPPRPGLEILIAGCGTSQAARYALREPDARITAIDVSDTSLRHPRELHRKYNLENLELHQVAIERVHEIGRSPTARIPTVIDPDGPGGKPLTLIQSWAILYYLAEKTGKLIPSDQAHRQLLASSSQRDIPRHMNERT